ncbi:MAG: sugar ABC transporter permease, partial [Proteobacteria bacterium]|nr:sugar ABC transporter permease [Pseudomonadota bacterium]
MRRAGPLPYLLIAPATLFLGVLFVVPLVQTIALAFKADGGWSLGNFYRMADDLNFSDALANTLKIVVLAVPLQLCLALGMAMMLRHVQRGRDVLLWVWSIPLGISDLAAGLVWLAILNDQGYLNSLL